MATEPAGIGGIVGLTLDHIEAVFDRVEYATVAQWHGQYDDSKGAPLYANPIPSPLPERLVAILVKQGCKHCHAFMAGAGYARSMPDGTSILYLDMHNPNADGSDTPALTCYRALGLSGHVPWEHLKLHGKDVPNANIPYAPFIPVVHFPILLKVVNGAVTEGITAGVDNGLKHLSTQQG